MECTKPKKQVPFFFPFGCPFALRILPLLPLWELLYSPIYCNLFFPKKKRERLFAIWLHPLSWSSFALPCSVACRDGSCDVVPSLQYLCWSWPTGCWLCWSCPTMGWWLCWSWPTVWWLCWSCPTTGWWLCWSWPTGWWLCWSCPTTGWWLCWSWPTGWWLC